MGVESGRDGGGAIDVEEAGEGAFEVDGEAVDVDEGQEGEVQRGDEEDVG